MQREADFAVWCKNGWFLALTLLCTLLCGLLSFSVGLLFLVVLALATAMQAVLLRAGRPVLCLLFLLPALVITYFVSSPVMLLPVASCTVGALLLSRASAKGEKRSTIAAHLLSCYAVALLLALGIALLLMMLGDGERDLFAYLDRTMQETVDGLTDGFVDSFTRMAEMYERLEIPVTVPTAEEIRETLLFGAALLPSFFLVLCMLPAIAATYLFQLIGLLCNDRRLFTEKNRVYRPGALLAGVYLFALSVFLFWGDIRQAFCLTCMNYTVFATPVFAFGALLQAPKVIAFMRRMSIGALDFTFFLILLIVFLLANMLYALLIMAAIYAVYILKSTCFPRKDGGGKHTER